MPKVDINKITDMQKLRDLLRSAAVGKRRDVDRDALFAHLTKRIKGQDQALVQIANAIYAGYARQDRRQPVATFLLVGPPGTGKTETAKAAAEYLFGSEADLIVINGAEFKNPGEGITKLIGAGASYKGSEAGGVLTRPMFGKKERVVLFDEIEKMHAECYDVFLSLLQDGYVTEQGSGKRADFTSAVVIMTSNLDHDKCKAIAQAQTDGEMRTRAFKEHFNARGFARPEILDRIPDIVYYQELCDEILADIAMNKIADLIEAYRMEPVWVAPEAAMQLVLSVQSGGGGIRDLMQTAQRRIGMDLADLQRQGAKKARVVWMDGRIRAVAE